MIYLLYEDAIGWKVARSDGLLDEFTRYYSGQDEATIVLDNAGIHAWLSKMEERQWQEITVK